MFCFLHHGTVTLIAHSSRIVGADSGRLGGEGGEGGRGRKVNVKGQDHAAIDLFITHFFYFFIYLSLYTCQYYSCNLMC